MIFGLFRLAETKVNMEAEGTKRKESYIASKNLLTDHKKLPQFLRSNNLTMYIPGMSKGWDSSQKSSSEGTGEK